VFFIGMEASTVNTETDTEIETETEQVSIVTTDL
jgi:hypothetical protein